jgi:hypothetical protein
VKTTEEEFDDFLKDYEDSLVKLKMLIDFDNIKTQYEGKDMIIEEPVLKKIKQNVKVRIKNKKDKGVF